MDADSYIGSWNQKSKLVPLVVLALYALIILNGHDAPKLPIIKISKIVATVPIISPLLTFIYYHNRQLLSMFKHTLSIIFNQLDNHYYTLLTPSIPNTYIDSGEYFLGRFYD